MFAAYYISNKRKGKTMIKISKTYQIVTYESAEHGEAAEHGFIFESEGYTFRELVRLMRDYNNPSCSPASGGVYEWLSNDASIDYTTGDETIESIHYSADNEPNKAKYWRKAMVCAGLIKGV